MFALPAQKPDISRKLFQGTYLTYLDFSVLLFIRSTGIKPVIQKPLMTWKYLQAKFPWDMIILIGGSFAMADGIGVHLSNIVISNNKIPFIVKI